MRIFLFVGTRPDPHLVLSVNKRSSSLLLQQLTQTISEQPPSNRRYVSSKSPHSWPPPSSPVSSLAELREQTRRFFLTLNLALQPLLLNNQLILRRRQTDPPCLSPRSTLVPCTTPAATPPLRLTLSPRPASTVPLCPLVLPPVHTRHMSSVMATRASGVARVSEASS